MPSLSSFSIGVTVYDHDGRKRLKMDDLGLYRDYLDSKGAGERLVATFEDEQEKRSSAANRYLWGVVYKTVEDETGSPKEVTHDEMCKKFLTKQVFYTHKRTGQTIEYWVRGGSSGLTPKAFHEFVEKVSLFFQEHSGITFPDAEDYRSERTRVLDDVAPSNAGRR